MESMRLYYNTEWSHFYSLAVCCVLSSLVKPPWRWWSQKRSKHVGN